MKRVIIAAALLCAAAVPAVAQQKLKAGYFTLEPFAMQEGSKATGLGVDFLREKVAPAVGGEIEFLALPILRMLGDLETGGLDMAVLLGKNPERDAKYRFAAQPYHIDRCVIAVAAASPLTKIVATSDLAGKTISISKGGARCPSLAKGGDFTLDDLVVGNNLVEQLLRKVAGGRVDAAHIPSEMSFRYVAQKAGMDKEIRLVELPDPPQPLYTVFRKDIDPKIVAAYDRALADAQADGSMAALVARYVK